MNISFELLQKYNVPTPRYTSYPTVPFWKEHINEEDWISNFKTKFHFYNKQEGLSLYLHLPFCESLCTYCGCNKKITRNHAVEEEYISYLLKEWELYTHLMEEQPLISELHLGGGTPTFFSPKNLDKLLNALFKNCQIAASCNFSFEGHPNNTTAEHLQTLYHLGFRRVSFGVQDNNAYVQKLINRIQPLQNVAQVTNLAKSIGYTSVNYDLIYGLPGQSLSSLQQTIEECIALQPNRIAFYSYAHVPWTSKAQRLFDEKDLPSSSEKLKLYHLGKTLFTQKGYKDIGMDHFALPDDELFTASQNGKLHRNFMGYTTQQTHILIGLGVSSISDMGNAYAQNHKTIQQYYQSLSLLKLPVVKGYFLSKEDESMKQHILQLICKGCTNLPLEYKEDFEHFIMPELNKLEKDKLIHWNEQTITVTETGKNFIRNICKAFDLHLLRKEKALSPQQQPLFSHAI